MLWKLLKQHISVAQLAGFFLANLCGMVIVLLSVQFYSDIISVFKGGDSFINNDYIVVSKKVSTLGSLVGKNGTFSSDELKDVKSQDFVKKVGTFQTAQFKVYAGLEFSGMNISTAMFFESVPDDFVDIKSKDWDYNIGDSEIPIVVPRNYLNLYNFGFAKSRNLPQISEGMVGLVSLDISLSGNGRREVLKGRIVGFSNRLNTILVPESFMNEANSKFGGDKKSQPSRLIIEVDNPADERIARYFSDNGYETEDNKLDSGKTVWFLKVMTGVVIAVGIVISILSFYILILSIYLLLQKNTDKLESLRLIGFSARRVSLPYQILAFLLNISVLIISVVIVFMSRDIYLGLLEDIIPSFSKGSPIPMLLSGLSVFIVVSVYNVVAISRKVGSILK